MGDAVARGDNAVLVLHGFTADSHAAGTIGPGHPEDGWWDGLIGPGRALDTDHLFSRLPQRARRLPGHDGAGLARARR